MGVYILASLLLVKTAVYKKCGGIQIDLRNFAKGF